MSEFAWEVITWLRLTDHSSSTVAVVIKVDRESLKVLDQIGAVRTLLPSQISNKIERRRFAVATDKDGTEIRNDDTVREVAGEQRSGLILHVHRVYLFLLNRQQVENSGVFVVRNSAVLTVAAKGGRATGPDLTKMNPALGRGPGASAAGAMPPPRTFGRDRLIGKTVIIRKGPWKGLLGIVKDTTENQARIELHTKNKIITVSKDVLTIKDPITGASIEVNKFGRPAGGAPFAGRGGYGGNTPNRGADGWDGSRTPAMASGGKTPAWGAFNSGNRTPGWKQQPASGSRTPGWADGSRTTNPYADGSRTAYGGATAYGGVSYYPLPPLVDQSLTHDPDINVEPKLVHPLPHVLWLLELRIAHPRRLGDVVANARPPRLRRSDPRLLGSHALGVLGADAWRRRVWSAYAARIQSVRGTDAWRVHGRNAGRVWVCGDAWSGGRGR